MPMTGLEEMKAAIEEESRLECAEIGRRAQEQAATIREEAQPLLPATRKWYWMRAGNAQASSNGQKPRERWK